MSLTVDHTTLISVGIEVENGTRYLTVTLEDPLREVDDSVPGFVHLRFTDDGLQGFASRVEATMVLNALVAQHQIEDEL